MRPKNKSKKIFAKPSRNSGIICKFADMSRRQNIATLVGTMCIAATALTACTTNTSKQGNKAEEYAQPATSAYERYTRDMEQGQSPAPVSEQHASTGKAPIPMTETNEEGYIDGEAAAEEDRLAGRPGMQSGGEDDDDDDEYEDGYDDGYEE